MSKSKLEKKDFDAGEKRINIRLPIKIADLLYRQAEEKELPVYVYARAVLAEGLRRTEALRPANALPGQTNLFDKVKKKRGGVRKGNSHYTGNGGGK